MIPQTKNNYETLPFYFTFIKDSRVISLSFTLIGSIAETNDYDCLQILWDIYTATLMN